MRRHNYEQFTKGSYYGLLSDCVYYCWQTHQITDDESVILERLCDLNFEKNKENLL